MFCSFSHDGRVTAEDKRPQTLTTLQTWSPCSTAHVMKPKKSSKADLPGVNFTPFVTCKRAVWLLETGYICTALQNVSVVSVAVVAGMQETALAMVIQCDAAVAYMRPHDPYRANVACHVVPALGRRSTYTTCEGHGVHCHQTLLRDVDT